MALEARINEELETNPVLEYGPPEREAAEPSAEQMREERPDENSESFDHLERLIRDNDFDPGDQGFARPSGGQDRDGKMDAMANTAMRPASLQEVLMDQWRFLDQPPEIRDAGEVLISFIDEDGYLRVSNEDVCNSRMPPLPAENVEKALDEIREKLEPVGVGARTLEECLLLQLDRPPGNHELERTLILGHLVDIQKNRYPAIAKATGRTIEEITEAVKRIAHLHPRPGALAGNASPPTISPDVFVEYAEDEEDADVAGYRVRLARGNDPPLRISPHYLRMLEDRGEEREVREFIRRNIEKAKALQDAIKFRKERLLEVAKVVIVRQKDFFEQGPAALQVLRMRELAEQFNCDPSTISRTVADKYMQTPRGIYPLRYFFTGGTENDDGQVTSWDSVRARVKQIVDDEDKSNPLNDDQIAAMLSKEHMGISRRTVAKYRQLLNIPAARQRKVFT
jgi:RNA polymerase sigma-54 factor